MRKGYKIGEIAKLFNISNRTLIHYDHINLLKPDYVDQENSYRYYSFHQIFKLYFIIILKKSGFSLEDIKIYTNSKNIEESIEFLNSKEKILSKKIEEFKKTRKIIQEKQEEFKKISNLKEMLPSIVSEGPFRAVLVDIEDSFSGIEVGKAYNNLFKLEKNLNLKNKKYIGGVDIENLKKRDFFKLKNLGILIPEELNIPSKTISEKAKFATILHKDSFESLEQSYEKLINFIELNSYEILGDSIEISNELLLPLKKGIGGILKILIPVQSIEKS
ncbi:MAG: MerR family transcriptional regulator [Fusobacteriaceae bacterium]